MEEMETEKQVDKMLDEEGTAKKRRIKFIILGVSCLIIIVAIIIIVVAIKNKDKDDKDKDDKDNTPSDESSYKFTSIETVNLPEGIIYDSHATYSKTGHIILTYKNESIEKENITYIGVMDEDGSNLKELWAGKWEKYYQSNGIRLMPFDDNKKILTGDYILECQPNIDDCKDSKLYPVIYPEEVVNMKGVYMVWSEIIVSPDEHIAWTTLSSVYNNINFIGQLVKGEENFTISKVQIISTLGLIDYEDEEQGIFKDGILRGGEIKQFTNGGEAITLAGAGSSDSTLAKSVFQSLVSEDNYPLTHFPGYEETTIISPDGKLGLTMTTRFSEKSSSKILGYMPRPLSVYAVGNMNRYAYFYGVQEVRKNREGNIGPALINIEESKNNTEYMGYDLHDEGWAFSSPLSWHPNCKKGMFSEIKKNNDKQIKRIRIVHLDNYKPGETLKNKKTPDNISYAKTLDDMKNITSFSKVDGIFKGKNSGYMIFNKTLTSTKSEYINYSDDGKTFYNGSEEFEAEYIDIQHSKGKLTSKLDMTGEKKGKMDLTITMNSDGNIIFEEDGQKISYGYVEYNGKKLTIEDSYYKE